EDYRISLNMESENGMFILPGKYTFAIDFRAPDLLAEGVSIMRNMLKPVFEDETIRRKTGSSRSEHELTNLAVMQNALCASMEDDFVLGRPNMTDYDHYNVAARLSAKSTT